MPALDDKIRASIKRTIEDKMSLSMIEEGMKGGWQQEHVHSVVNDSELLAASSAPDKSVGDDVFEEAKIPVHQAQAEPIIVEYNPDHELQPNRHSFVEVEDEINLIDLHFKAKLEQSSQIRSNEA